LNEVVRRRWEGPPSEIQPRGGSDGGGSLRQRLRSRLSRPSSLEDLPFSGVLLINVRRHLYHPLSFVDGSWWGSNLDERKRHGRDRRW